MAKCTDKRNLQSIAKVIRSHKYNNSNNNNNDNNNSDNNNKIINRLLKTYCSPLKTALCA